MTITRAFAGLLSAILLSANGCLVTGCASMSPMTPENAGKYVQVLRQAGVKGRISLRLTGSPLAFRQSTNWELGPDLVLEADGDANPNAVVGHASDPALSASLPPEQVWLDEVAARMPVPKSWIAWSKSLHQQVIDLREQVEGQRELLTMLSAENADKFQKPGPPSDKP